MIYRDAQDTGLYSRRVSRRIARLCNRWRNAEDGPVDKQAGTSGSRNRLSRVLWPGLFLVVLSIVLTPLADALPELHVLRVRTGATE